MGAILQEIREKIKSVLERQDMYLSVVLVLVAVASFGLGRQSVTAVTESGEANEPARMVEAAVTPAPAGVTAAENTSLPSTYYVASKSGKAYHLPHCSGAKSISEANKITFATKAEAEAAGYRPAANCKGI